MGIFEQFPYSNFHNLNLDWIIKQVKKVGENLGIIQTEMATFEKSANITSARKLSTTGNFTGTIQGKSSLSVLSEIASNMAQIQYIFSQFSDGQTGFVIDGGFFLADGIRDNYSGGSF